MIAALPLVTSLALGAVVSTSDLGVVVVGNTSALATVVSACPRAVKVASSVGSSVAASVLADYRAQCTGTLRAIVELPSFARLTFVDTADAGASDADVYWTTICGAAAGGACVLNSLIGSLVADDVQWLSGPSNFFDVVDPNALGQGLYAQGFLGRLAQRVRGEATARSTNFHLLLPPFGGVSTATGFCSALEAARVADPGIGWTFRAIASASLAQSEAAEPNVFGYRAVDATCSVSAPLFVEVAATGGWGLGGARTTTQLLDWLRFVDQAVDADADVHAGGAVLLRSFGGGVVNDLDPIAAELAIYLASPGTPPGGGGGPSTGGSGPLTGGGAGASVPDRRSGCGTPGGALASLAAPALLWRLRSRRR